MAPKSGQKRNMGLALGLVGVGLVLNLHPMNGLGAVTQLIGQGSSRPRYAVIKPGATITLTAGQTVHLTTPETSLKFNQIINDSRCPQGAQCVWAGDVTLELTWQTQSQAWQTTTLSFEHPTLTLPTGQQVTLIKVLPYPSQGGTSQESQIPQATFNVS